LNSYGIVSPFQVAKSISQFHLAETGILSARAKRCVFQDKFILVFYRVIPCPKIVAAVGIDCNDTKEIAIFRPGYPLDASTASWAWLLARSETEFKVLWLVFL
jgi:hypothetical protein